ncbi:uncharacterized protein PV09_05159 [Verruconis gallopava]|uniref:ADF-H domain-containing protein n=1 Tax=Verruconis gallopava TaxID=253628 RepID=A0A0D1YT98_9PEZI|nr:uncharacterized protein PV09_05159 [Verruconis gallopava]KIW03862.1 hypothetical protein PV09_05159 [Verruconis gallopava]
MSLSGLDSPAVEAAVQSVSHGRGGWFLIHYTSRDSVDVLSQGTKGVAELREAAEKYYNRTDADTEATRGPLYGMIDFRRRKVLLKLVPDETSRLVKARVQVHWASVTSRFPTHDSVFELTSASQLTETNITAHTELHSGRSSAGSNKKPVLDGISEEGAEEKVSPLVSSKNSLAARTDEDHQVSPLSSAETTIDHSQRISALISKTNATNAALQESLSQTYKDASTVPLVPVTSNSSVLDSSNAWQQDRRPSTDSRSMHEMSERRLSSQSGRPSTATESLYDFESLFKPKVKLGPRPATATRPGSKSSNSAPLPSGLRSSRPPSLRPKSRDSTYSAFKAPPPPPIPESSTLDFSPRPRSSGQSVKSLPATLPKSPGMTREKQRLMKFREMYKEKENKRAKDKETAKEAAPPEPEAEKVDSPTADEDDEMPELSATISNPQAEFPQRLSVISEVSTMTKSVPTTAANTPTVGRDDIATFAEKPTMPTSIRASTSDTSALAQEEADTLPKEPMATPRVDEFGPSGDSTSTMPTSSPTSLMDSSELTNSTRATSVSDDGDNDKSVPSEGDLRQVVVETPIQATAEDDQDSESSTPTAAPAVMKKDQLADDKEKRRAAVSPLVIPAEEANPSETDGEHSFDDDLMDELDGAEVQEAFSVSVSKSPITPFFQRRPSSALTPNSPASVIVNGKVNSSPLPSPLPVGVERTQAAPAGSSTVSRTTSGNLLGKEVSTTERHVESNPEATSTEEVASPEMDIKRDLEHGQEQISEVEFTREPSCSEADPHEKVTPQKLPRRKSSLTGKSAAEKVAARKSRIASAAKVFSSRDKSPADVPNVSSSRVSSTGMLNTPGDDALSVHKRRNLGTGVAAKIADLQRNFSKGSSTSPPLAQPTSRKSSMVSIRASSIQDSADATPPKSAHSQFRDEHLFRGRAMSKGSMRSFESRTSTPPRNKSSSSIGKLDSKRFTTFNNPTIEVSSKPDTIQVKATIIRTDTDRSRETNGLGLQNASADADPPKTASTVEPHYAHPRTSVIVEEPRSPARTSTERQRHRRARSSISSALGLIGIRSSSPQKTNEHPASPVLSDGRRSSRTSLDMSGSLRSLRRRASASLSRSPSVTREARSPSIGRYSPMPVSPMTSGSAHSAPHFARTMSTSSLESSATMDHESEHKRKGSRTSRMLKRMSNSMSSILHSSNNGNESAASHSASVVPTVEEEKWVGADLGEMNVQFPDTLLWKRRYLEVDTQGYLILKPHDTHKAKHGSRADKLDRRYHLSQFFPPFSPDMERMEMPYSVVLDFRDDGGTLQVAADSGIRQSNVLRVLSEAHRVCSY